MQERFNAAGTNGRDCPVCLRTGTLGGDRAAGCTLTCIECRAAFRFLVGIDGAVDTLERLPYEPPRILTDEELRRVGAGASFSFHDSAEPCRTCGSKHCICRLVA